MQEHMLSNMPDHLASLNEIIGDLSNGKFDEAAKVAEQLLGISSLTAHYAVHMAPFFRSRCKTIMRCVKSHQPAQAVMPPTAYGDQRSMISDPQG